MNEKVGNQKFVQGTVADLVSQLKLNSPSVQSSISAATGATTPSEVETHRQQLLQQFTQVHDSVASEAAQEYVHYASRISIVGLYQSLLAKLFEDFPDLQGYGDKNVSWLTTVVEEVVHSLKGFFAGVYEDVHKQKKPLLQAIIESWKALKFDRAPYPAGVPQTITIPDKVEIALLADWGGDNPAARNVAATVRKNGATIAIHLGDIYYGGVKQECETFLRLWPMQGNLANPGSAVLKGSSYALNGNHEMYSGGESYFNVVLKAFNQPQPFFCLQNSDWRIIGLDTAYEGGSLKPANDADPIAPQWAWLVDLLKLKDGRANILLTHHQPVSAHIAEYGQSQKLRDDIKALLATEGVADDAIFAWFFGHEHRCAIYQDTATAYNARLIGSGCIPHERQTEVLSDPGCTPFTTVNRRGEQGTDAAVSMYAELHFFGSTLSVFYIDEDDTAMGSEQWYAHKGRLQGTKFAPADGYALTPQKT